MSNQQNDHYREVLIEAFQEAMEKMTEREKLAERQKQEWWWQLDQDEEYIENEVYSNK